jgi:hypothetical protein
MDYTAEFEPLWVTAFKPVVVLVVPGVLVMADELDVDAALIDVLEGLARAAFCFASSANLRNFEPCPWANP